MDHEIRRYDGIHTSDPDRTPQEIEFSIHVFENVLHAGGDLRVDRFS